jgi:N-acyl-D-amino-acid deacylase
VDLVLRGGTVIDGLGGPPRPADVGVRNGTVVAVEPGIDAEGARDVDAAGLHIVPGFIDIHTHSDYTLIYDGRALSKIRQGVTTEVIGNCGGFAAPAFGEGRTYAKSHRERVGSDFEIGWATYSEYLKALDHGRLACNVVPLVGHANLRACVVGLDDRRVTVGRVP